MSLKQATLSGAFIGRSAKTVRMPWFANAPLLVTNSSALNLAISAPATTHTKSAWTQVVSSTSGDIGLLLFSASGTSFTGDNGCLIDIAVGAAGSETAIASNIPIGEQTLATQIPVFIPSGSRIAMRGQAAVASVNFFPNFFFFNTADGHLTPRSVDTIGAVTSTSRGTALSGASGSYTEITASTASPYQALCLVPSNAQKTGNSTICRLTLAVGAAGSEVDIGSIELFSKSNGQILANTNVNVPLMIFGRPIPAGTRLSVKHNFASNPDRMQVAIIGVPFR